MHYFRIPNEYWEDRLLKLKLAGLNTVETVICWNLHEPNKGEFCFEGDLDIVKFIKTAEKLGLYVIVRPGPYICAEWEFGGFPAWLLKDDNMRLRCYHEPYLAHVKSYFAELLRRINPLQHTKGGNILCMQIENEYGSYGNDTKYKEYLKNTLIELGVDVLLFTSDGENHCMQSGGSVEGVYQTINFGSNAKSKLKILDYYKGNGHRMCMEFWSGWFDHFGERHHTRKPGNFIKEIKDFLDMDASFNLYMFHGGTSFGWMAGANHAKYYQPTVTSYDYCALLNEYGDYTPAYYAFREVMCAKQGIELTTLPVPPVLQNIGKVKLTKATSLFDNMENIGKKHYSSLPESMEFYGQNYGFIYYKTVVKGKYDKHMMCVEGVHDRAHVYVDGKLKQIKDATEKRGFWKKLTNPDLIMMPGFEKQREIGVLVEAMGRVNYGDHIMDKKGISRVKINNQNLMCYEVTTLPMDNLDKLDFSKNSNKYPLFFKGEFHAKTQADCFIELTNFTKAVVFVNGKNIGRFWKKGPQKNLYLPGVWLKECNEIIILEVDGCSNPSVNIVDKPSL